MANPDQEARTNQGRYARTPEKAERDTEAARLHAHGYTDGMIAEKLGYPSIQAAREGRRKVLAEITQAPAAEIIELEVRKLDMELVRLEHLERDVRKVLDAEHITVSNGKVIIDPRTEQPLADDSPILQAADRLVKIEDARRRNAERRARLLGLDAEQKVSVSGSVRYEVVGVDTSDLT
ncbi:hypothetical protein ACJWDR_28910 [Streptomyces tauricus]|uniref:hypothetical protein n=1 Tax=Streptomyces tauricus TaxID=68274 RepID=UPI00387F1A53